MIYTLFQYSIVRADQCLGITLFGGARFFLEIDRRLREISRITESVHCYTNICIWLKHYSPIYISPITPIYLSFENLDGMTLEEVNKMIGYRRQGAWEPNIEKVSEGVPPAWYYCN